MIIDDPNNYWVWIRPSKPQQSKIGWRNDKEYYQHYGKWLVFSRDRAYLEELARKLDPYVEEGKINSAKYSREPAPFEDSLVMCVYCDDRKREDVWKILQNLGVTRRIWKYERQTIEDWLPGGRLYRRTKAVNKNT